MNLYIATPELFLIPTEQSDVLVRAHGCISLCGSDQDRADANALLEQCRNQGFHIACGCRQHLKLFPVMSPALRYGRYHLRQINDIEHAPDCPLSLQPQGSSRRPNMRTGMRLREIATRLRR